MNSIDFLTDTEIKAAEALLVQKITKKSLEDISKDLGISRRHLFDIRQKQTFKAYMRRRAMEQAAEDLHEVISALKTKAKKGDVKAIRTLLEVIDAFPTKKHEIKQEINATHSRSDEAIEAERREIEKELQQLNLLN
ncbi:phBC6A51 family helix-turn-helix protein [Priestia megaterium]|uniref:phBC6A51 family helix-turn-helix protein n=1 Tax=Priestia megaterium TaxID=1404 RepID=UPI001FB326AE|nr:phBC6A51 family helix-turn-helix protein [Priestia megaterium]